MSGSALLAISGFRMVGRPPMAAKIRGVLHVCKESTCERMEGMGWREGGRRESGREGGWEIERGLTGPFHQQHPHGLHQQSEK